MYKTFWNILANKLIQSTGKSLVILKTAGLICLSSLTLLLLTRPTLSSPIFPRLLPGLASGKGLFYQSEEVVEASHSKFETIWKRYKILDVESKQHGKNLLECLLDFNTKNI